MMNKVIARDILLEYGRLPHGTPEWEDNLYNTLAYWQEDQGWADELVSLLWDWLIEAPVSRVSIESIQLKWERIINGL